MPNYKYSWREKTSLHGIRYTLAKRNCKGRAIYSRYSNRGILIKLKWFKRTDSLGSMSFLKWDKVNVLPNHFLGGSRR